MTIRDPFVYIGTYTIKMGHVDGKAEGIYVYALDRSTGTLRHLSTAGGVVNPSFLMLSPDRRFLYAAQELGEFEGHTGGGVSAFAVDQATGALTLLNSQPTHGADPCYATIDQSGGWLLVANYSGGNVTILPIQSDGSLGPSTQVIQHHGPSQYHNGPHPHSVITAPTGNVVLVQDCGLNKIFTYHLDVDQGTLAPGDPPIIELPPASGPRHATFHAGGVYVYCINEQGSSVTALAYDSQRAALSEIQTLSTLPEGFTGRNSCADIHVHPNGRFVYGSNRGDDSIAAFVIDQATGRLQAIGHVSTQGRTPRNFAIDPAGELMLAANQDSSTIAVYRIDSHGLPVPTGYIADVPTPVCVEIVDL